MMVYFILKSYFVIVLSITISAIVALAVGLYIIIRNNLATQSMKYDLPDIAAIAGDDIIATQLDLARAYIETNQFPLARNVLAEVVRQGTMAQQEEAKQLLNMI